MENIQLDEQNNSKKENYNNNLNKSKTKNTLSFKNDLIGKKPQKRTRDYSPTMDIEEEEIPNKKKNFNTINRNKRMKVPLRKLIERIQLDDKDDKNIKNQISKENNINNRTHSKKRGIKIFSDMSVSEISNNLFKNYYPCLLPSYYPEQITGQIIDNQLEKLISNFNQSKSEKNRQNKIKIYQNLDYLRQLAEKQGEWVTENYDDQIYYDRQDNDDDEDYDKSDSNNENNSNNTYPEDESIENEDDEKNFGDEYDDYDNNDDYYDYN